MGKIAGFFKAYRGPLVAGVLYGTSYVPFPPWAILFAVVPLLFWIDGSTSRKQAFWGAWLFQFTLTIIGFYWIAHTAHEFGDFPWWFSVLTLVAFAAVIHLYFPLAALLAYELKKRFQLTTPATFFVAALLFSLAERVWPTIFPFHLGYTLLWARLPFAQWADVIGFAGLSTLIWLANAWIATMWRAVRQKRPVFGQTLAFVALLLILAAGGVWKKELWSETDARLNVLTVQANIGNLDKIYAEQGKAYQSNITSRFVHLTQQGLQAHPETDLVIWPETAFPDMLDQPQRARTRLEILAAGLNDFGKPLLVGAYSRDNEPPPTGGAPLSYNALFLIKPNGDILSGPYRKTMLLAFGEYMPLSEEFPILLKWLPFISNFGRGKGPAPLDWSRENGEAVRIGGQICYEGLFPEFSRGLAEKGANVLANVTNDSWFGEAAEPYQHMIMTLARAIEVRRPLVRSTNTGITTAMLANGDLLEQSPLFREWNGLFPIAYKKDPGQTFYVRAGHFDWVLMLIALVGLVFGGRFHARSPRSGLDRGS